MAGKRLTITEIAQAHCISRNHLTKVVMTLAEPGLLKTMLDRGCRLKMILGRALAKFMTELDGVTLADVVGQGTHRIGIPVPVRVLPRSAQR